MCVCVCVLGGGGGGGGGGGSAVEGKIPRCPPLYGTLLVNVVKAESVSHCSASQVNLVDCKA